MVSPRALTIALPALVACGLAGGTEPSRERAKTSLDPASMGAGSGGPVAEGDEDTSPPPCEAPVPAWRDGVHAGWVCPDQAALAGLTVLDLSDAWTPRVFSEDGTAGQPYRTTYLALADERLRSLPRNQPAERYLELYGIQPTFRVLHERIAEDARHGCHDAVDDGALALVQSTLRPWAADPGTHERKLAEYGAFRRRLEATARQRGAPSIDALRGDPSLASTFERWDRLRAPIEATRAAQAHLHCDGLLGTRVPDGLLDWQTSYGLRIYQQRHVVVSAGFLDAQTRRVLALDSREADFLAVLRTLRERVVDATGLIEDGSAAHAHRKVLGRELDPPELHAHGGQPPAPSPAPDLVSPATEAAARALGWTDASSFRRSWETEHHGAVAVPLPPLPAWHSPHMELRAEIDRGDVSYVYPDRRRAGDHRRPVLTLYTRYEGEDIALVQWATTIGGWKPERGRDGAVRLRYKGSPVGPRVWRDLIASPAWLPPPGTPDSDLVRQRGERFVPNHALLGPGYRSAYGLAMLVHHEPRQPRDPSAPPLLLDEGVRTHGSVSYRSILVGSSHGCHRLYNHLAVRLTGFVLAHREHVRRGRMPAGYQRQVSYRGASGALRVDTRGYLFELTPPVPVEVLEGTIHGPRREPPTGARELPQHLVEQVETEAAEDG